MNSGHNWDSQSHQTLYERIHGNGGFYLPDGAGVSGAVGAQEGWAELADLMARARERTEGALASAGAVWEGDAADSMRSGVTPLARWADDAYTASLASQASTDAFVSAYSAAKNQMPEPVPVTSTANSDFGGIPAGFTHLFGGQTDQDKQEAAAQEAKVEAVRVMSVYDVESGVARVSAGRFVPPPSVTVNVAPGQPVGGDFIPVGVSEWPGSGRAVDDGDRSTGGTPLPGGGPVPGGSSTPPSGHAATPLGATTPSFVGAVPSSVSLPVSPGTFGLGVDQQRFVSVPAVGTFSIPGRQDSGGGRVSRFGGGISEGGGRGPGGAGPGAGGSRGAVPGGGGGFVNETVAGRPGARGATGMGVGPVGSRADGEEDRGHKAAEYLVGSHDSFWDDTPPVAPAVIGDEDDD